MPSAIVRTSLYLFFRLFIANKEVFPTAVPLELALQHRRKEAAEIILLNTDCDRQRRQVDWGNLAMGEIEPAWLENIKWVETILLVSNFLQRVPDNIHILGKLSCLDLRKNLLKTIPVCLLEMPSLCNLWLSENKIAELPKQCNWSSSLKTLDLNDNLLQTLPKSMAKAKLTSLHVARNNLYYLPSWIEQMASLQLLDVSGNPRLKNVPQKLEKLNQTKSDSLIGENHQVGLVVLSRYIVYTRLQKRRAKKVVSDSPGLVDFAIGPVNSVLNLAKGQVKFFEEFKLHKNCVINPAYQNVLGAS